MSNPTPKAARNFTDAGTGRSFKADQPIEGASEGELENYRAAGLIASEEKADEADKPATQGRKGA